MSGARALLLAVWLTGCDAPGESEREPPPQVAVAMCETIGIGGSDCDRWSGVALPAALPEAMGNRFADDDAAAELGFELFFDIDALSSEGIRCAACHAPEHAFADDAGLSIGAELLPRNALALVNAARSYPYFWDGRADSLWSQALAAIESPDEMAGDRLAVAHRVTTAYGELYARAFGSPPDLTDLSRFPAHARPGTTAWAAMGENDREMVTVVFVNVGKAFEAYLRRLASGPSAVDRFLLGEDAALTPKEQAGMRVFSVSGCMRCHSGSSFSDGSYHRLDLPLPSAPAARALSGADRGRAAGVEALIASEFNALSPYFDRADGEEPSMVEDLSVTLEGAFRTPSLRNLRDSAPYGHNGVFPTLESVVRFHLEGGGPASSELEPRQASEQDVDDLVAFLLALQGETARLPWSAWPQIDD